MKLLILLSIYRGIVTIQGNYPQKCCHSAVEEPAVAAARANHLAAVAAARGWSFHDYNTKKTREGLKTSEKAEVRKKRFFLGESGLNLAALLAVDILPTGITPTNFILVRLTVKVEDEE